jgi:16S rRNA (adenine1518-N6/adenine1519-N6)-dimethyltransferase
MDTPYEILKRHNIRAKHSWGQNFLSDPEVLRLIARAAALTPDETVLEIGPGLGHLTRALLDEGAKVVAVERDRDMVKALGDIEDPRLKVVEANAAHVTFAEVAEVPDVTVVGNLPYHLTSPILFEILDQQRSVKRAVLTVQKEVADRLAAKPGGRDYGLLTVLLDVFFVVESLHTLPARLFHPPPKVDSAVIRLTRRAAPKAEISDEAHFRRVVKAAFAQRRKTLLNSLKSDKTLASAEQYAQALSDAGIDPGRRAETLATEEFAALERALPPPPVAS